MIYTIITDDENSYIFLNPLLYNNANIDDSCFPYSKICFLGFCFPYNPSFQNSGVYVYICGERERDREWGITQERIKFPFPKTPATRDQEKPHPAL